MGKITYDDKVTMNENASIPAVSKGRAVDWNEIKNVVNENDDKVGELSDLETENKSSLVGAVNSLVGTVLYDNENGSNDTITLSDSLSNYRYIEIFYKNDDSHFDYSKILNPNGKTFSLISSTPAASYLYLKNVIYSANELKITPTFWSRTRIGNNVATVYTTDTNAKQIYIKKVLGYK